MAQGKRLFKLLIGVILVISSIHIVAMNQNEKRYIAALEKATVRNLDSNDVTLLRSIREDLQEYGPKIPTNRRGTLARKYISDNDLKDSDASKLLQFLSERIDEIEEKQQLNTFLTDLDGKLGSAKYKLADALRAKNSTAMLNDLSSKLENYAKDVEDEIRSLKAIPSSAEAAKLKADLEARNKEIEKLELALDAAKKRSVGSGTGSAPAKGFGAKILVLLLDPKTTDANMSRRLYNVAEEARELAEETSDKLNKKDQDALKDAMQQFVSTFGKYQFKAEDQEKYANERLAVIYKLCGLPEDTFVFGEGFEDASDLLEQEEADKLAKSVEEQLNQIDFSNSGSVRSPIFAVAKLLDKTLTEKDKAAVKAVVQKAQKELEAKKFEFDKASALTTSINEKLKGICNSLGLPVFEIPVKAPAAGGGAAKVWDIKTVVNFIEEVETRDEFNAADIQDLKDIKAFLEKQDLTTKEGKAAKNAFNGCVVAGKNQIKGAVTKL